MHTYICKYVYDTGTDMRERGGEGEREREREREGGRERERVFVPYLVTIFCIIVCVDPP